MKKLFYLALVLLFAASCIQKKNNVDNVETAESEPNDSTIYGICGDGTMMHTLELITNMQDTLYIEINDDETSDQTIVAGGMMSGDRMAVTARKTEDGMVAQRILNLTSLLGKWSSIDKSFEITDDGGVRSFVKMESNKWTEWRIINGQLLLNRDTFDIVSIGADSLEIENKEGIFSFKRVLTKSLVKSEIAKDSIQKH